MESLWSRSVEMPAFECLDEDLEAETVIIGGGMAGLLTAYKLKEKGKDAVILEADRICTGQTANTTAKITCQHGLIYDRLIDAFGESKAAQYARANLKAVDEYERIIKKEGIECSFKRLPSYLYTQSDENALNREFEAAKRLGVSAMLMNGSPLPFVVKKSLCFESQAQFNPLKFTSAIAKKLKIYEKTKVYSAENGVLKANGKTVRAKNVVVATHYPFINAPGYYFLRLHQARSYAVAFENCEKINGMYYGIDPDALSLREYGNMIIAGGGSHITGECKGNEFSNIAKRVKEIWKDASETARWSAQDCMPPDSVPYIGKYSKNTSGFFVATGFQKWGMTNSMAAAEIVSDMICGIKNENAEVFSPQRSLSAGAGELCSHAIRSVNGLVIKKLKMPKKSSSQLKSGEGGIVRHEGKTVAAYRDESGNLHIANPNCSHLGCRLSFNSELNSWDCPCHGSRFDVDGRLIDNPSIRNLK
ncbi:MAG: FAD-dependent oxidoreductase [Clostridia bacterium]|nr:FAD-dependent oxidoreductase [Clostridia bacterium]